MSSYGPGFIAGSQRAQVAILFHELGHIVGALADDGGPDGVTQSLANNGIIGSKCSSAIGN